MKSLASLGPNADISASPERSALRDARFTLKSAHQLAALPGLLSAICRHRQFPRLIFESKRRPPRSVLFRNAVNRWPHDFVNCSRFFALGCS